MPHEQGAATCADRLQGVPGMADLPRRTRASIDAMSTQLRVCAGHVITKHGDPARQSFVILDGIAIVRCNGEPVAERTAGSLVGEAAVVLNCPSGADVIAATDVILLVLSPAELATLCDDREFRGWLDTQIGAYVAVA